MSLSSERPNVTRWSYGNSTILGLPPSLWIATRSMSILRRRGSVRPDAHLMHTAARRACAGAALQLRGARAPASNGRQVPVPQALGVECAPAALPPGALRNPTMLPPHLRIRRCALLAALLAAGLAAPVHAGAIPTHE